MMNELPRVSDAEAIESFHLAFLRVLQQRLPYEKYVLKGGANMRYYLGSHRYSRDLDFDTDGDEPFRLEEGVDAAVGSDALRVVLLAQGLRVVDVHKPKQTSTTQRWKVLLSGGALGGGQVWTKVEFSRREIDGRWVAERIKEFGSLRGFTAPVAPHYLPAAAAEQKVRALAGREATKARDVFDLHLLLSTYPEEIDLGRLDAQVLMAAGERVATMTWEDFREQVIPFLDDQVRELYTSRESWEGMKDAVLTAVLTAHERVVGPPSTPAPVASAGAPVARPRGSARTGAPGRRARSQRGLRDEPVVRGLAGLGG
jgi:hypothetical protein